MPALFAFILSLAIALSGLLSWVSYLVFCGYVLRKTQSADSLDHAAKVARAYREGLATAIARLLAKLLSRRK